MNIAEILTIINDIMTVYNELKADGVIADLTQDLSGNPKVQDLLGKVQGLVTAAQTSAKTVPTPPAG